jgi:flagellar biosynthesis protein FlhF
MQVKKFEARSVKEALEMIKVQLGPDAIILSAKEITKGFGLGGEKSVEVTAAYSEATLQKKKFVESRLPNNEKEKFQKISARDQKEVMRKMIENQVGKMNSGVAQSRNMPKSTTNPALHKVTEKRYIDIDNESATVPNSMDAAVTGMAKKAWNDMEVNSLKQEIESLKQVMTQFKSMPQSFVQAHPGAEVGVNFNMSSHYQRLINSGVMSDIAGEMIQAAQNSLKPQQIQNSQAVNSFMAKYIMDSTAICNGGAEQFHLFIGPSGSGKTSSLIKLASELILNQKKRIAIISTDTSKVGAAEQMKIFSQILNVPFLSIRSQQDWAHVIPHLDQLDHVLVDFAGLNLKNPDEVSYMKKVMPPVYRSIRSHLVLSSASKDADLIDCAKRYEAFGYDDVIFSALDEATQHGNIYNFIRKVPTELFAFGIGPKVPEDFEFATAERVVDLILKITQNRSQEAQV